VFDAKIISACIASAPAYRRIVGQVDPKEFTPTGRFWWGQVEQWYATDAKASSIDRELLRERGLRAAGRTEGLAREWFDALPPAPSPENVAWEVLELKRVIKYRELASAIEEEWDREKILALSEEHAALMRATTLETSTIDWGASLEELSTVVGDEKRIRLWPEKLNEKCGGGALPGHHIVAFGRPESGKTLFAVNMVAGWLRDGYRVLYVGNEDNINLIKDRVRWNLSGMTKGEIAKFPEEANRRCLAKGWNGFYAVHLYPGSAGEIEQLVEQVQPQCLVVDQLRNLDVAASRGGTKAQRLDQAACDIRQILAKNGLVGLSIGQANAGEHGQSKVWLDTGDFDESRTGVPGQADLMVGIGFDASLDAHNQRALSLPKNKLSGDHTGVVVTIDKLRSKMR